MAAKSNTPSEQDDGQAPDNAKRAGLKLDTLEPRILLSATWIEADTGDEISAPTDEAEVFNGTEGADVADALGGDDELFGYGGDDTLAGGDGNDLLDGGTGNDSLSGGDGFDRLFGQAGDDELDGGAGNDWLFGGDGNDALQGGEGNDLLFGQAGDDKLDGGNGNDWLLGGDGNDTLQGGDGFDILIGQAGDDTLDGGAGTDWLLGGEGNDTLQGGEGNDLLLGQNGNDWLFGGDGNDALQGGEGNDLLFGQAGDDKLDGGNGNDWLLGGEGNDTLHGGEGNDLLLGQNGNDHLDGGEGNDLMAGQNGNDTLQGGGGDDRLYGGLGNDALDGGAGNDALTGGDGFDRLYGQAGDDILDGGNGNDWLLGGEGNDTLRGGDGFDLLVGQAGDDNLDGGAGNDWVVGVAGSDTLKGGEGNDLVISVDGDDTLIGDEGNDTLYALAGDNTHEGGAGDDLIIGGTGEDVAVYSGKWTDYTVTENDNGTYTITDNRPDSPDGTDTVANIETFRFANGEVTWDDLPSDGPTDLDLPQSTVAENAADGTTVGTVQVTDPDALDTHTFTLADDADGRFAVDAQTGEITVADGSRLDYEQAASHDVTVEVTDAAGNTYAETLTISLTDVNEVATDLDLPQSTVAENAADGTTVGTVQVTDPDALDTHTFTLADDADGRFAVDAQTGEITVADGSRLDYEQAASHDVTVEVTDAAGNTYAETLTISLTDVNEGIITADDQYVTSEDTPVTTGNVLANDYDLDGDDISISQFTQPANGTVVYNGDGTFSYTPNADFSGTDEITYTVTDGHGMTAEATITFDVAAEADVAELSVQPAMGYMGATVPLQIDASVTDVDGSETLSVEISGLPEGASLSAGTPGADGVWTLSADDLDGLHLSLPNRGTGDFELEVTAITTEANGDTSSISQDLLVEVVWIPRDDAGEDASGLPAGHGPPIPQGNDDVGPSEAMPEGNPSSFDLPVSAAITNPDPMDAPGIQFVEDVQIPHQPIQTNWAEIDLGEPREVGQIGGTDPDDPQAALVSDHGPVGQSETTGAEDTAPQSEVSQGRFAWIWGLARAYGGMRQEATPEEDHSRDPVRGRN